MYANSKLCFDSISSNVLLNNFVSNPIMDNLIELMYLVSECDFIEISLTKLLISLSLFSAILDILNPLL